MDENEITQRLRETGNRPVPGEVRSTHLSQMHAATPTPERTKRFGRLAVAAAAFAGFAVGSTGFAMAGALPDPAQQVAHDVLSVVQVDVKDPKANRGQCVSAAARNNTEESAKREAKAACPKGGNGKGRPDGAGPPEGRGNGKGRPDHAGTGGPNGVPQAEDPCKGPPPWAGKAGKGMSPEAKRAAQDARGACPADGPDERKAPEPQDQAPPAEQGQAGPPAPAPDPSPPAPPADEAPPGETPVAPIVPSAPPAADDGAGG